MVLLRCVTSLLFLQHVGMRPSRAGFGPGTAVALKMIKMNRNHETALSDALPIKIKFLRELMGAPLTNPVVNKRLEEIERKVNLEKKGTPFDDKSESEWVDLKIRNERDEMIKKAATQAIKLMQNKEKISVNSGTDELIVRESEQMKKIEKTEPWGSLTVDEGSLTVDENSTERLVVKFGLLEQLSRVVVEDVGFRDWARTGIFDAFDTFDAAGLVDELAQIRPIVQKFNPAEPQESELFQGLNRTIDNCIVRLHTRTIHFLNYQKKQMMQIEMMKEKEQMVVIGTDVQVGNW
jgi:hypothetical protein